MRNLLAIPILVLLFSFQSNQQSSDGNLLERIKRILTEKESILKDLNVDLYYNQSEKILDIDAPNYGFAIPLKEVSMYYKANEYRADSHYLEIKCKSGEGCMESSDSKNISLISYQFKEKKTVYEVMELIQKLSSK